MAALSPSMSKFIRYPYAFDGAERWKCTRRQRPSAASAPGAQRRQTRVSSVRVVACVEINQLCRVHPILHPQAFLGDDAAVLAPSSV